MKIKLLILSFILISVQAFAQYPEVKISDIQYIHSDSLLSDPDHDYRSEYYKDTVVIVGVAMNPAFVDADVNGTRTLNDQSGVIPIFIQDTSETEFGGIYARFRNATAAWNNIDSGMVIKVTGVVGEYYTTTQFDVVDFQFEDIIEESYPRPEPVLLTIDSLMNNGDINYLGEKWEHVLVEVRNVTVTDLFSIGSGTFGIFDENGNTLVVGNKSQYWRDSQPPLPNTKLEYVRGYIENRSNIDGGWFIINPVYPEDIKFGDIVPPSINDINRNIKIVKLGEEVEISAKIYDDVQLDSVALHYSVNGAEYLSISMTDEDKDSIFTAVIPAVNDSSIVAYFVEAIDNQEAATLQPSDTVKNLYFYIAKDREDITIQEIQYSPFGGGYSAYHGDTVTVSGVVTADTSDIDGKVYMQDGTGPWSGIWVKGTEAIKLKAGDDVTVTAVISEDFGVTYLRNVNSPDQITVNSENNDIPEPVILTTAEITDKESDPIIAESYESVLVSFENVEVTDENADGDPGTTRNYGEIAIKDQSESELRVELQDGTHGYHNFWTAELENEPTRILVGDKFSKLTGVMYYSFGNYKLIPRKDADFEGYTPVGVETESAQPLTYALKQNFPNPFNPSTTIEYVIPEAGIVSIKVYNVLGKEVQTLVNANQSAGVHRVTFNASNLSSGVYFYRIDSGKFNTVKKMLLVK